ncbi:MAG TPA: aspartate--tRNA ligase [Thermoanaerobaculia bacterium]|nr:aspartate--tRNA ligase [Thermoanaerobaculia bacterium]
MKRQSCGTLTAAAVGQRVLLQAWVHRRRDHGGVIFLDLRDRSGRVQVVVHPQEQPQAAATLDPVRIEWVVEVEGTVVARAPEAVNPELATGEIEVRAERAAVLGRSKPVPFSVDGVIDSSEETRLRYRFLDLRRDFLQRLIALRHQVTLELLKYLDELGFLHIETPMLTRSTPEGARDFLVPSRVHRGEFFALPQSPQLFKQILMISGFERYVQIARCFRDEDLRLDRQPEFTQVDLEMSFIEEEDVYALIEGLFARIFPLVGIEPRVPFRRIPYREAMLRYGSDRPDLRVDLEIHDLTDLWPESGFRAFQSVVAAGGVIRALPVPGAADASRKQVDGFAEVARRYGAQGVLTLKRRDGVNEFQVKDVLRAEQVDAAAARLGLEEGGLAVVVAAAEPVAAAALGALRLELGRHYGHMRQSDHELLWVTDFPLVEWNADEHRWDAVNHPFTSPVPGDVERLESDPGSVLSRGYDVVLNGIELGGGSIRIHDPDLQERVFALLGIGAEEARERFGFLLDALSYGAPPHGGIALGLDRLIMLMGGGESLRDVIAFPKTATATCLMTGAPSPVDPAQLLELGVRIAQRPGAPSPAPAESAPEGATAADPEG